MRWVLWSAIGFLMLPVVNNNADTLHIQTAEGQSFSIERSSLEVQLVDEPLLNESAYQQILSKVQKSVYSPPQNAFIDETNNIVQEHPGTMLNDGKFRASANEFLFSKGDLHLEAPLLILYPRVDSETLAHIRTKLIGSYITYFNTFNKERTKNITLATEKINNAVVFPGEVFSFNEVVGKRTKEKGYEKAPVIVRGELSEDIGGGICQVSSTLFNAVDRAGVAILERYHHSKRVPYVPLGRDATVSWYGPDFTFRNDYNQPVLISARITGGQLIVKVYSSDTVNAEMRQIPGA
ncbi:hypothetical protein KH172YL63_16060 [Bacillus sp. KH172YL63]|nr:VanW family protein [Bacillus sp. KH172YL63]BCB03473.1 hypothetical protein KH172YL63_16060 [Bacillus sp. KH172YL63]